MKFVVIIGIYTIRIMYNVQEAENLVMIIWFIQYTSNV